MTLMVLKATDHTFLLAGFGRVVGNTEVNPERRYGKLDKSDEQRPIE